MSDPMQELRNPVTLLPVQSRMARVAVGWGVRDLAKAAEVSPDTIARLERGESLYPRTVAAIRAALEAAGVEFIEQNGGGPGVRLAKLTSIPEPDTSRPADPRYPGMRSIGPESEVRGGPEAPEQAEVQTDD